MNRIYVMDLDGEEQNNDLADIAKDVCQLVIYHETSNCNNDVNIYMASNEEIRKINKEHRDIDEETDVLSFELNVHNPETDSDLLGEIIISIEKAKEQADELGHSLEREVAFLSLHGMLHLLKHDHENDKDEEMMIEKQKEYIEIIENEIITQEDLIMKNIKKARKLLSNSYAPYSNFPVSCILVTSQNKAYEGVNVENISYGATSCAERNAIFHAVSKGKRDFKLIVIASMQDDLIYPCGICRQVMVEFLKPWTKIVVTRKNMEYKIY